ncbi:MAG: PhoH family protein [Phycisphaerae bacterium]|nr:PhoH family protein [Phycisphaerae bacterium]
MRKNYVLDANILIHDPQSVFQFADNTVIIPVGVISEIDRFKKEMTDRGYSARAVVRLLDGLRNSHSLADGVPLENGGHLRVYCDPQDVTASPQGSADIEILRVARAIHEAEPTTPVVIVTKDINLRIRADAVGLRAEDYESDRVELSQISVDEFEEETDAGTLETLREHGEVALGGGTRLPNAYGLLRPPNGARQTALVRVSADGQRLLAVKQAEKGLMGVKPRNKEQYFAVDALLDDDIQLVTLMGKAGTGKTLLAIAAALQSALRRKQFRRVLVARPVVPMGRDIGYLPGEVSKKLEPWMKPITDTLEYLLATSGPVRGQSDAAGLMQSGLVELQPLTYIRGRNISNRFVVIDEAQNLTPLEVKTIITRMGADAKVVLTGDPHQIDNPYVDASSSGFTYLVKRFRGQAIAAHVQLRKGERSSLAELAANLL